MEPDALRTGRETPRDRAALGLPADPAATVAHAGVNLIAEARALQEALKAAIAERRGSAGWDVDEIGWRVDLLSPDRERFHGGTLAEALAWCLVWLMVEELGVGLPA